MREDRPVLTAWLARFAILGLAVGCGGSGNNGLIGPSGTMDGASEGSFDSTSPDDAQALDAAGDGGGDGRVDTGVDATLDAGSDGGDGGGEEASDGGSADAADAGNDVAMDAGDGGSPDAGGDGDAGPPEGGDGSQGDASDATLGDASDAMPVCDGSSQCGEGGSCCSGQCVDTAHSQSNCGACGNACSSGHFCTGTKCDPAIFSNLCDNPSATVVFDPYPPDDEAGAALGTALATACSPSVSLRMVSEFDGGVVDPDSGRPLTGVGNTFVAGGGSFGQQGVAYMDTAGLTPLYVHQFFPPDGGALSVSITDRTKQVDVVSTLWSNVTAHHDYFILELSVEPVSGTLCFFGAGLLAPGTLAAGYWASTQVLPNAAMYTQPWYVFEWTDTNLDGVPNAGDSFNLVAGSD